MDWLYKSSDKVAESSKESAGIVHSEDDQFTIVCLSESLEFSKRLEAASTENVEVAKEHVENLKHSTELLTELPEILDRYFETSSELLERSKELSSTVRDLLGIINKPLKKIKEPVKFSVENVEVSKEGENIGKEIEKISKKVEQLPKKVAELPKKIEELPKKVEELQSKVDKLSTKIWLFLDEQITVEESLYFPLSHFLYSLEMEMGSLEVGLLTKKLLKELRKVPAEISKETLELSVKLVNELETCTRFCHDLEESLRYLFLTYFRTRGEVRSEVLKERKNEIKICTEAIKILAERVEICMEMAKLLKKHLEVSDKDIETSQKESIFKARSLALEFMSAHACCVRAVPYENDDKEAQEKQLTIRLYIHTNGDRIPQRIKKAAKEMFTNFKIDYCDLQRRPLNRIVTQLPSSKKNKEKLSELSKLIEKNLHVFEDRLNVTAVQASYKVTDAKETDQPCVTVFVLGKGKIPAGETSFEEIEKLHAYPYDIAEGYHQPAGSFFESYASPLHSGVGIGVKDDPDGVGTLGGFLKDKDGKYYILSCEHVLRPARMQDSTDLAIIVQPSKADYVKMVEEAEKEKKLSQCPEESLKLTQEELEEMDEEFREKIIKQIKRKEDEAEEKLEKLEKVKRDKPRKIGTYTWGVKDNIEVNSERGTVKVFVDAAIAELENSERLFIQLDNQDNPLYGFAERHGFTNSPNGEIVNMAEFEKELSDDDEVLTFMKVGRTTGAQKSGIIDRNTMPAFINCISPPNERPYASPLSHAPYKYCKGCKQPESSEEEIHQKDGSNCSSCGKKLERQEEVTSFWLHNCLMIRQRDYPFCIEGDSGALVFDSRGRAWGQVVGVFRNEFLFCLVSPLSATLEALQKGAKIQNLKLWCRE